VLTHLVPVSENIIVGDGACSAFRVKGKLNGWMGRVRRTYGINLSLWPGRMINEAD